MVWLVSIMGLVFVAMGLPTLLLSMRKDDPRSDRILSASVGCCFIAFGLYLAWPLVLLADDFVHGTQRAAALVRNRQAVRNTTTSLPPWGVAALFAAVTTSGPLLAWSIWRVEPHSIRAILLMLTVPIGLVVLAAPAAALLDDFLGSKLSFQPLVQWCSLRVWQHQSWLCRALVVLGTWLSCAFASHSAALPLGPFTTIIASPLMVGSMIQLGEVCESDRAWWIKVLWWVGVVFVGFGFAAVRQAEELAEQTRRNELADALVKQVLSTTDSNALHTYTLYIRAFITTAQVDVQTREHEALSFETVLERALRGVSLLIALARGDEHFVVGAARVYLPDDEWWQRFQTLAARASHLLVIPTEAGATAQEIGWLIESGYLRKCIFLMPETATGKGLRIDFHAPTAVQYSEGNVVDHWAAWQGAQKLFRERHGLQLPNYDSRGALLTFNESGVPTVRPLGLAGTTFKVAHVRKAFMALTKPVYAPPSCDKCPSFVAE
jgi:hypothetical protein